MFRRAGDRWGLAIALLRTAELDIERGRVGEAEAALEEARTVLGDTQLERWNAHTLAALAEVAVLQGDPQRAAGLLADARERYAAKHDAIGVSAVDKRIRALQMPR